MGAHKPDCLNYGAPGAMPPLADDDGDRHDSDRERSDADRLMADLALASQRAEERADGGARLREMSRAAWDLRQQQKASHRGDADREAYEERAAEFRGRVAAGATPTEAMAAKHAETSRVLLERAIQLDAEDGAGQWPSSSS